MYEKFLQKENISICLPYFGGYQVYDPPRRYDLNIQGLPFGFYKFFIKGRNIIGRETCNREDVMPRLSKAKTIRGIKLGDGLVDDNGIYSLFMTEDELVEDFMPIICKIWPYGLNRNKMVFYDYDTIDIPWQDVRTAVESQQIDLLKDMKGITPALRHACFTKMFQTELLKAREQEKIEREQRRLLQLEAAERAKREQEEQARLAQTLEGRLKLVLGIAQARLLAFEERGPNLIVRYQAFGHSFESIIRKRDFWVVEAGICLSTENGTFDTHLNFKALLGAIQEAIELDALHKTRHV